MTTVMQWFSEKLTPFRSTELFYRQNKIWQGQHENGESRQSNKKNNAKLSKTCLF